MNLNVFILCFFFITFKEIFIFFFSGISRWALTLDQEIT